MEIFWRRQALKSFWIAQWNSLQKPARSSWCNPNIFDSRIDPESEFVVLREGFLKAIQNVLKMQPGALLTAGPPCASFTFINQGTSKRSRQRPFGNCLLRYVAAANQTLVFNKYYITQSVKDYCRLPEIHCLIIFWKLHDDRRVVQSSWVISWCIAKDHSQTDAPCDFGLCAMRSHIDRATIQHDDGSFPLLGLGV